MNNEQLLKEKLAKLTVNQYKFFINVTDPTSPTSGEILKSYLKAGYKDSAQAVYRASKLYNSKTIQDVLTQQRIIGAENKENRKETAFERVVRRNEQIYKKAEIQGDLTTLKQCNEFDAKLHGLLVDKHQVIDRANEDDIDQSTRLEAARIAEQRLLNQPESLVKDDPDIIDADFTATDNQDDPSDNDEQQGEDQWLYD